MPALTCRNTRTRPTETFGPLSVVDPHNVTEGFLISACIHVSSPETSRSVRFVVMMSRRSSVAGEVHHAEPPRPVQVTSSCRDTTRANRQEASCGRSRVSTFLAGVEKCLLGYHRRDATKDSTLSSSRCRCTSFVGSTNSF